MINKNIILGINGLNIHTHDASASIIVDGKLIFASSEERFTGIKHSSDFPVNAVKQSLVEAGIDISEVDEITYPFSPKKRLIEGSKYFIKNLPSSLKILSPHPFLDIIQKKSIKTLLAMKLNIDKSRINARIRFVEHHLAHAASAFYPSPFFESGILTLDGIGEMDSGMIAVGIKDKIIPVKVFKFPNSLGLFYRAITTFLGFLSDGDEGKIMGLSSYGDDSLVKKFRKLYKLTSDGFILNRDYFNTIYYPTGSSTLNFVTQKFIDDFGLPRPKGKNISKRDMNIAHALQVSVEEIILHLVRLTVKLTGFKNLTLAGGVALNSCANGKILNSNLIENIYIQPASADDGTSFGSALYSYINNYSGTRKKIPEMPYYGFNIKESIDLEFVKRLNFNMKKMENPPRKIAQLIYEGNILGFAQGRAEFGPRALGNRSILADPRIKENKKRLNDIIKKREWFRPFAPMVVKEKADIFFENCKESPYMLLVFNVIEKFKEKLPAITHIDGTARVQTVTYDENPYIYDILLEFEKLTDMPVLLNTSFNGPGKPLINNFHDALKTFLETDLDYLIVEDYLIGKNNDKSG